MAAINPVVDSTFTNPTWVDNTLAVKTSCFCGVGEGTIVAVSGGEAAAQLATLRKMRNRAGRG